MAKSRSGTASSSSNSNGPVKVKVIGVPTWCSCGDPVLAYTSRSSLNPNRRYFRCRFAADKQLVNDDHAFKWVDEALLDEFETLSLRMGRLEAAVQELKMRRVYESEDDFTVAIYEAECRMKKWLVVVVLCFIITFAIFKIVG